MKLYTQSGPISIIHQDNIFHCNVVVIIKLCVHFCNIGLTVSTKTKCMLYNYPSSPSTLHLTVSSGLLSWPIDCVSEFKYLGVVIDSALCWKAHITRLKTSLRNICRNMYVLRRYCLFSTVLSVYNGLVNSLLCYCVCAWGSASNYLINAITVIQKRILRVINKMPARSPSLPLFKQSSLLTCRQTFVFRCLRPCFSTNRTQKENFQCYQQSIV